MDGSSSTCIIRGASDESNGVFDQTAAVHDVALENCPKCNALLDVSGFRPLTETSCPTCGALIKVLREFHHFVLLSELGHGGAGTVFRAFDETLERDVALKLLRNENTRDLQYLEGLEQEALVLASISHPHVVKVFSTGRKNGFFYIAMEIVGGGSLAERIARPDGLTEVEVLSLGIQLAEGLNAAYERGLLHGDVKPGNILFADRETIKVADFGLAVRVEQATGDSDDLWGTPDYIAPEKLLRHGEDVRSDIYSLGCTLFHCLAGVPPLDTTTVLKIVETQVAEAAPDIQKLSPHVSGATAFVIKRCLEKNPVERYQSYHEVIQHLHYAREQLVGPASASPADGSPARNPLGKKAPYWIALAAVALIAAVVVGFLAHRPKSEKAAPVSATAKVAAPRDAPAASGVSQGERYQTLDMRKAYTADTRTPLYAGQAAKNYLTLARRGIVRVNGVSFEIADPEKTGSGFDITILEGHKLAFPKKVSIPVAGLKIRQVHILGGVAAWGWDPRIHQHLREPVAKLTVTHRGGATEIFEFSNGVEFADHVRRIDVPGSEYADGVAGGEHQLRTFSVALANDAPVEKLTLESVNPNIAPIFVALTAELRNP
jgi:serine/threonine protein kinase